MSLLTLVALSALLCLPEHAEEGGPARKRPARVYTNDDLDRLSPLRGETGVLSTAPARLSPAAPDGGSGAQPRSGGSPRGPSAGIHFRREPPDARPARGEEYWRREAERLRDRLEPLRERARELALRLEERRRTPGVRPFTDARVEALRRRVDGVEARIRELESSFEDRARRAGALPGWLR